MTAAIEVRNLTKRFRVPLDRTAHLKYRLTHPISTSRHRELLALRDVSFDVPEGQFLGIVGANGSGKSTLLKILARIYRQTSGSVRVRGQVSPFLELGVGFNPELTGRENVFLNGAILGLSRTELSRRMDAIMHFAELEGFADQKLKNYSSGMQVRLGFTVAIQAEAAILLMDEVLAVGDARFQAKCFEVFARYKREGRTVVLVTHDLIGVEQHCDRALLLERGEVAAEGDPTEVTSTYRRRAGVLAEVELAGGDDDAPKRRWGTGAVRMRRVLLESESGAGGGHFETGGKFRLEVEVEGVEPESHPVSIGFALHRSDTTHMTGTNTLLDRLPLPALAPGERLVVDYAVPELPLLDGSYRLDVAVESRLTMVTYDRIEGAATFTVTDPRGRAGFVNLGGRWNLLSAPPEPARRRASGSGR